MITRSGVAVAVSAAALLTGGILADHPELVMLGLAGVAALLLAAVWLLARPRLFAVREIRPDRVPEGDPAWAVVTVTNVGRRRSPPLVITETVAGRVTSVPLPSLAAGREHRASYQLPTARRGRHVLPAPTVGHSDPLRLLRVGRKQGGESVLFVHPRVHRVAPVPLGGARDVEGPTSVSSPRGGVAFHSLREYQPDDDWRLIHWRSTARTGTLMARYNVVPDEPRQLIVLDTSATPYGAESFEDAVRIAASLCAAAERSGYPLTLRTTGDTGTTGWGGATAALDRLSTVEYSTSDNGLPVLPDLLRDVASGAEGVALAIVTGRAEPVRLDVLTALRSRLLTACLIQVGEPAPGASTPPGVLALTAPNSEEFAVAWNRLVAR